MTDNEVKANYLDIYADIFGLKEDLKNVQKPISDLVRKFFGTTPVNTTLASISEFINKQNHSTNAVNTFFGVPTKPIMALSEIIAAITR